jgi:hypothetical protein
VAFRFSRSAIGLDNLPALVAGLGVAMPANCGLQEICWRHRTRYFATMRCLTRLCDRVSTSRTRRLPFGTARTMTFAGNRYRFTRN